MTAMAEPVILPQKVRDKLRRAIEHGDVVVPRSYQATRLKSESRFNLDNWSRQTGKTTTNAMDSVHLAAETGYDVIQLSASLDQTKEFILKSAIYAETLYGLAGEIQREVIGGATSEVLYVDRDGMRITQQIIGLPGGERIIGRPGNPRTARGLTGHVKLDEFSMHEDQDEIWAAAYPTITSNPHLRMDVSSTPGLRTDDKFAKLCSDADRGENDFVYRVLTIYDAVKHGLQADPEQIKRNLGDPDRWRREYLCEFVDEAGALITYELIRQCQSQAIVKELPSDYSVWDESTLGWSPAAGELYIGMDIGRRHDLTVIWLGQMVGDMLWTRGVTELFRVPFHEQQEIVGSMLEHLPIRRMCIDETGMGMMLTEELGRRYGNVEGVTFTAKTKEAMAEPVKSRFDNETIRIPVDPTLAEDLHSIRKIVTPAGNIRYAGERTSDGHADRFWALALCNHAASNPVTYGAIWL